MAGSDGAAGQHDLLKKATQAMMSRYVFFYIPIYMNGYLRKKTRLLGSFVPCYVKRDESDDQKDTKRHPYCLDFMSQ